MNLKRKNGNRNLGALIRVCMGNGKHGKSWNYRSSLSRPGKSRSVDHGKPWKIK